MFLPVVPAGVRKLLAFLFVVLSLCSCDYYWRFRGEPPMKKVWGNRPVYAADNKAREISYLAGKHRMVHAGNIYTLGHYIFQVDVGRGIHVIDNADPAHADRVGFIQVYGCAQLAIRGGYLYTNSISDLVTLDLSDPEHVKEVNRVPNAFPSFRYHYPLVQPEERGYYDCPRYDSVVVGWVKDSIFASCYKN